MSLAEIITELPKLSPTDLRVVRRKLIELAEENHEAASCVTATLESAGTLDRLEALALLQDRLALDTIKVGAWQTAVRVARR